MRWCLRIRKSKGFIDLHSSDSLSLIKEIGKNLIHTFDLYKSAVIFEAGIKICEIDESSSDWKYVGELSDNFYQE